MVFDEYHFGAWRETAKELFEGEDAAVEGLETPEVFDAARSFRARHGAVTDFLDLHLAAYHWPAFNLADVAVVTGTALLLLDGLRDAKRKAATGL